VDGVKAANECRPAVGSDQGREDPEKRCLSAAVRAKQREELARWYLKIEPWQDGEIAELFDESFC